MYCTKCGAELPQGSKFCPKCGTATDFSTVSSKQTTLETHENSKAVPPVNQDSTLTTRGEVRCPKCGASGCTPHYKQNISGGGYGCLQGGLGALIAGPFGLLCGFCGRSVKTSNTLVWVCPKCGNEFRSREETYKGLKRLFSFVCGMIIIESLLMGIALSMATDGAKNLGDFFGNLFMALLRSVYKRLHADRETGC